MKEKSTDGRSKAHRNGADQTVEETLIIDLDADMENITIRCALNHLAIYINHTLSIVGMLSFPYCESNSFSTTFA
jgi:hypothetical protein